LSVGVGVGDGLVGELGVGVGSGSSNLFSDGSKLLGVDRVLLFELLTVDLLHGLGKSFPFIFSAHLFSFDHNEGIHFHEFSEPNINKKAIVKVIFLVELLLHQDDVHYLTVHNVFIMLRYERNNEVE